MKDMLKSWLEKHAANTDAGVSTATAETDAFDVLDRCDRRAPRDFASNSIQTSKTPVGCGCGEHKRLRGTSVMTVATPFLTQTTIRGKDVLAPASPSILRGGGGSTDDRSTCRLVNDQIETLVSEFRLAWNRRRALADAIFHCTSGRGPLDCYSFQVRINQLTERIIGLQDARAGAATASERAAIDAEISSIDRERAALYEPQRTCDIAAASHSLSYAAQNAECARLYELYAEAVVDVRVRGDHFLRALANYEQWIASLNRSGLGCTIEDHGQDRWRGVIARERALASGSSLDQFPLGRAQSGTLWWGPLP